MTPKKPPRINMTDAVMDLAPAPPPCFPGREMWIQYLISAVAAQNSRNEPKVILFGEDRKPYFNKEFPICADCSPQRSAQMKAEGRCKPDHLNPKEKEAA